MKAPTATRATATVAAVGASAATRLAAPNAIPEPTRTERVGRARPAATRAPISEPSPSAPLSTPYSRGPPPRVSAASRGITTWELKPNVPITATSSSGERRRGSPHTVRRPSRIWPGRRPGASTGARWSSSGRIAHSAAMTARYDPALTRKAGATPAVAMTAPAAAGPRRRPALNMALLSPTAFGTSSGPTISMTNDWRVGMSTICTMPSRKASRYTIHSSTLPAATSAHRVRASTAAAAWVTSRIRRLSKRSAITPPHIPNSSMGRNCRATVTPRSRPLPVRVSTSQLCATCCIHVPDTETSWPRKNRR